MRIELHKTLYGESDHLQFPLYGESDSAEFIIHLLSQAHSYLNKNLDLKSPEDDCFNRAEDYDEINN